METEHKSLSVLIPVEIPVDTSWINDSLKRFINQKMEVILLHVVDTRVAESLNKLGIGGVDSIYNDYRVSVEARLQEAKSSCMVDNVQTMVVEGIPFLEIIKLSKDLHVDMIAMKVRSNRGRLENVFFGSTTEYVLRGSPVPVMCLP